MSTLAIQSTGYQTLTLDQMHESSTKPRRTFEPNKLAELVESLRTHGLVQPITRGPTTKPLKLWQARGASVRHRSPGQDEALVRILNLTDEQSVEIQIVENSQRIDVQLMKKQPVTSAFSPSRVAMWPSLPASAARARFTSMRVWPFTSLCPKWSRRSSMKRPRQPCQPDRQAP